LNKVIFHNKLYLVW